MSESARIHGLDVEGPVVAIVIRTRGDRPRWLREAIASVLAQRETYPQTYVVVVIDGPYSRWFKPLDAIEDLLGEHARAKGLQTTVTNTPAGRDGRADAANRGVSQAPADLVGFLDDDDVLRAQHVATLVRALTESPAAVAACSDVVVVECDAQNRPVREGHVYGGPIDRDALVVSNQKPNCALLWRREVLLRHTGGPFVWEDVPAEDWGLLLRVAVDYGETIVHVPAVTAEYRQRPTGSTTDGALLNEASFRLRKRYRRRPA